MFSIAVLLALSLPIEGADWAGQFAGWDASSWAVLVLTGAVVCVGLNYLLIVRPPPAAASLPVSQAACCFDAVESGCSCLQ